MRSLFTTINEALYNNKKNK